MLHICRCCRDGRIEGLRALYPDGEVFNTPGTDNANAPDSVSASTLTAGDDTVAFLAQNRDANAAAPAAAAAAPGFRLGGTGAQRAAANSPREPGQMTAKQIEKLQKRLETVHFKDAVQSYLKNAPAEVQLFAATPIGQSVFDRLSEGAIARMADETARLLANITETAVSRMAEPVNQLAGAASNLTSTLAMNATNLALKGAAAGIEAVAPALGVVARANRDVVQPLAEASRKSAASLAEKSAAALQETIAKMPEGDMKKQAQQAAAALAKGAVNPASSSSSAAQMGKRRMLH
jgi:hypothetical protein